MKSIERLIVRYLQWRGWIVFWLDNPMCSSEREGYVCWLKEYVRSRGWT
jgi:hypothetical protein